VSDPGLDMQYYQTNKQANKLTWEIKENFNIQQPQQIGYLTSLDAISLFMEL
jgi:hypothetical protein